MLFQCRRIASHAIHWYVKFIAASGRHVADVDCRLSGSSLLRRRYFVIHRRRCRKCSSYRVVSNLKQGADDLQEHYSPSDQRMLSSFRARRFADHFCCTTRLPVANTLTIAAVCPFVGYLQDLFGKRYIALFGAVLLCAGCVVLGSAQSMAQALAGMAIAGGGAGVGELTGLAG